MDQEFPKKIDFVNEKGILTIQAELYECKPIVCIDCKGIGHTREECRQKRYELGG